DRLVVKPSRVQIRGLVAEDEYAEIDVAVDGPLLDAMRLIDHEPLGYLSELGLDISGVEGRAAAKLHFAFPLLKDLEIEQVKLAVTAELSEVALPKVVAGHTLSDADLTLALDGDGMELSGTGKVLG